MGTTADRSAATVVESEPTVEGRRRLQLCAARSLQELSTLPPVSPWCCNIAHEQRQREDDDRQARRRRPSAAAHLSADVASVW
eukprot:CAMPEP_0115881054 /NCGR_PEP_ID=MMETSP0287-20121206/28214_1 /TAXON_ID=412157 /ORGANISM="Chrysochromulina rotalis, Strain UIO044" /LENGTH=82 /DNA_ID=CAMNT_0003336935 /DNA_START=345 /DNA_END=589 /DNA_ORIENTATION=-